MVSSWVACTWLAGYLTRLEYLVKYSYPLTVEYVVHKLICNWVTLIVLIKGLSLMSSWVELSMSWWVPDWTWAFSYPIQVGYIVRSPVCNPHWGLHIYVWLGSSLVSSWVELSMSWWVPDWTWAYSYPLQVGYRVVSRARDGGGGGGGGGGDSPQIIKLSLKFWNEWGQIPLIWQRVI